MLIREEFDLLDITGKDLKFSETSCKRIHAAYVKHKAKSQVKRVCLYASTVSLPLVDDKRVPLFTPKLMSSNNNRSTSVVTA